MILISMKLTVILFGHFTYPDDWTREGKRLDAEAPRNKVLILRLKR